LKNIDEIALPSTPDLPRKAYSNEMVENIFESKAADDELMNWREVKILKPDLSRRNYSAF